MPLSQSQQVIVFAEERYSGNSANVILYEMAPDISGLQRLASQLTAATTCFAWPATKDQNNGKGFEVRCFNHTHPIHCCGHGLLAVAGIVLRNAAIPHCYLYSCDTQVTANFDGGFAEIIFPVSSCHSIVIPDWVNTVFSHCDSRFLPVAAAISGDDDGYLVLQWPNHHSIADLTVDVKKIEQHTRRAVVVTQDGKTNDADYYLRYFAPQYGVDEDNVTGSANRILASYWRGILKKSTFKAIQCSSSGGVVYSRVFEDRTFKGKHHQAVGIGSMLTFLDKAPM